MNARSRDGFTLVELLLVVALLAGIAALALPPLLRDQRDRAFAAQERLVVSTLELAAATARLDGAPLEVRAIADGRMLEVVRWQTAGRTERGGGGRDAAEIDDATASLDEGERIEESWGLRRLGDGLTLRAVRPSADALDDGLDGAEPWSADAAPETIRLALFLPDGTAAPATPRWLLDADGRLARIDVDAGTGRVAVRRETLEAPPDAEDPFADEALDETAFADDEERAP